MIDEVQVKFTNQGGDLSNIESSIREIMVKKLTGSILDYVTSHSQKTSLANDNLAHISASACFTDYKPAHSVNDLLESQAIHSHTKRKTPSSFKDFDSDLPDAATHTTLGPETIHTAGYDIPSGGNNLNEYELADISNAPTTKPTEIELYGEEEMTTKYGNVTIQIDEILTPLPMSREPIQEKLYEEAVLPDAPSIDMMMIEADTTPTADTDNDLALFTLSKEATTEELLEENLLPVAVPRQSTQIESTAPDTDLNLTLLSMSSEPTIIELLGEDLLPVSIPSKETLLEVPDHNKGIMINSSAYSLLTDDDNTPQVSTVKHPTNTSSICEGT